MQILVRKSPLEVTWTLFIHPSTISKAFAAYFEATSVETIDTTHARPKPDVWLSIRFSDKSIKTVHHCLDGDHILNVLNSYLHESVLI